MATIGVKIELEGTKEYQQGMKNLKEQTKLFDAELKNLKSSMNGSAYSKTIRENELLKQKMEALTKESELLAGRIEQATEKFGENDTRTLALQTQYEKLQGQIAATNEALEKNGGVIGAIAAQMEEIGNKAQALGQKISGVGETLSKNVTMPLAAVGTASAKTAADFESAMSGVAATMGYTVDELNDKSSDASKTMEKLSDFAQEMGATTAFSATESAEALNYMALAGYDAETSMKMLPTVLDLAAAGEIGLAEASDMVTDAQSALNLTTDETATLVDQMASASSKSNTSVAQLGEALLTVGATAANVNGGTEELATVLGVLADNGIKGAEGGTHLRNMILSLQDAAKDGKVDFGNFSVEVYDANGNFKELSEIMMDVADNMEGMSDESKDAMISGVFNKTDLASVNALLNTSSTRFKELKGSINGAKGAASEMAAVKLNNLSGQITLLKSSMEGAAISIGNALLPKIKEIVSKINELTNKFNSLSQAEKERIVNIGLVVAAIGPLLVGLGKVVSAVGAIMTNTSALVTFLAANPVLAGVTVALGLATVALVENKQHVDELYHSYADLDEEQRALAESAKSYNEHIDDFISNNEATIAGIESQYSAEQKLKEELSNIVDENGRVKEGYEERAQVLTDQLAQAFGIEIQYQDGVILKYQEVMDTIDQVIEKKKAEALLSTGQAEYTQALADQVQKYEDLKKAQEDLATTEANLKTAQEELKAAQEEYDYLLQVGGTNAAMGYVQKLQDAAVKVEGLQANESQLKDTLAEAETAFYNNQAVISNYEALQEAVTAGTADLDVAITNMKNNLIDDAPISFLQQQAEEAKTYYEQILRDYESGEVKISEEQLAAAQSYADQAALILQNAQLEYHYQGEQAGAGYVEGLTSQTSNVQTAARNIVDAALATIAEVQKTGSPAQAYIDQGEYGGEGYAEGLRNKMGLIQTTLTEIDTLLAGAMADNTETLNTSLLNDKTAISSAMAEIISKLGIDFTTIKTDHSQTMTTIHDDNDSWMSKIIDNLTTDFETIITDNSDTLDTVSDDTDSAYSNIFDTISSKMSSIVENIGSNCTSIEDHFSYLTNNSNSWGSDFIGNFESGINSRMSSLLSSVQSMASRIASYMHFSVPDKGPLSDADEWMPDFMKLLAEGIDSNSYLIDNAVKGLALDMSDVLSSPIDADEIYGAVRAGASDATTRIILNGRDLTRGLRDLGVAFNG